MGLSEEEGEQLVSLQEHPVIRAAVDYAHHYAAYQDRGGIMPFSDRQRFDPMGDDALFAAGQDALKRLYEVLAAALLPPGTIPIPAQEIAALREFASAVLAHEDLDEPTMEEHNASVERVRAAIAGLQRVGFQPGDREPLAEGA